MCVYAMRTRNETTLPPRPSNPRLPQTHTYTHTHHYKTYHSHAAVSGAGGSPPSTDTVGPSGAAKGRAASRSASAWADARDAGPAVLEP